MNAPATIVAVERAERPRFAPGLLALERGVRYPLGDDWFEIDHGRDPFAFFDRLGDARTVVAIVQGVVVGTATAVLRRVPFAGESRLAWYLCDFKVAGDARGGDLARRVLAALVEGGRARCAAGYAVSMDPADGRNRVALLARRLLGAAVAEGPKLDFLTFDAQAWSACRERLAAHLGPVSVTSLAGVKDIVLASTGAPMPLVHVQHGPLADPSGREPARGELAMLALRADDPLAADCLARGAARAGRASVLHVGLADADFRFVLSSDV